MVENLYIMSIHSEMRDIVDGWISSGFQNTPNGALEYLRHRMYVVVDMPRLRYNGTCIKQKAMMYWQYRNEIVDVQPSEIRALRRQLGNRAYPEKRKLKRKATACTQDYNVNQAATLSRESDLGHAAMPAEL